MPDVLETLKKLPASCIAEIGGKSVLITRGVMSYRHLALGSQFYLREECTDSQRQAMIVGCTLGWHHPGADPDSYVEQPVVTQNQTKFTFMVPMVIEVDVVDYALDHAEKQVIDIAHKMLESWRSSMDESINLLEIDGNLQLVGEEAL